MIDLPSPRILTVTEITRSIQALLATEFPFVTITGEISNLRHPSSGHLYFTLKDEASQIRVVMFKQQQRYISCPPADGQHVICRGRITVYEPRGDYQLLVDFMELKGEGLLQAAFEQLKKKLAAEGLFAEGHKRKLPLLPAGVALVTSADGAAVFDFLKVAANRFPSIPIEIFPVRVQGDRAAAEIVEALKILNERKSSELIVLCRGGGSLEDLWPFNEEKVARAIFASELPVVSAIGHEIDFTIADFVADRRAPTPTAAAELVIPDRRLLLDRLSRLRRLLIDELNYLIKDYRLRIKLHRQMLGEPRALLSGSLLRLDHLHTNLLRAAFSHMKHRRSALAADAEKLLRQAPTHLLLAGKQRLHGLQRQMMLMMKLNLARKKSDLQKTASLLEAVNPDAILGRGYAVVRSRDRGEIIRSSRQTEKGQSLEIRLHEGELECEVTDTIDKR